MKVILEGTVGGKGGAGDEETDWTDDVACSTLCGTFRLCGTISTTALCGSRFCTYQGQMADLLKGHQFYCIFYQFF